MTRTFLYFIILLSSLRTFINLYYYIMSNETVKFNNKQWIENFKKNNYRKGENCMAGNTIIYSPEPIIDGSEFNFGECFFANFFEKNLDNPKFYNNFIKLEDYSDSCTVDFSYIVGELSPKDFDKYIENLCNGEFDRPNQKKLLNKIYSYYAYIVYSPEF